MIRGRDAVLALNALGRDRRPFFFFTDFLGSTCWYAPLDQIDPGEILFSFPQTSNVEHLPDRVECKLDILETTPETYEKQFKSVIGHLQHGNSFLVNLTSRTPIRTNLGLREIFGLARAPYKVWFKEKFTFFSPEPFVRIRGDHISSHPMKGTIDAEEPNARERLLTDPKEMAEHITIVDLIRNDLSKIARKVTVPRFRYVEEIKTNRKHLLQMSSEVRGEVTPQWHEQIGDMLFELLPAGSVSGAPKEKTMQIISDIECGSRGYYSGVCGLYDGTTLETAVMIRFIEQEGPDLYFRSGGGITSQSTCQKEYQEMLDKIYVPIH